MARMLCPMGINGPSMLRTPHGGMSFAGPRRRVLGNASVDSLRRYDDNFLRYYPYLDRHVPWARLRGKHVLEIGLGYGTVSQKPAESGAFFAGLGIAINSVAMVNHRLRQSGLVGKAIQGNILMPPFGDSSFNAVVAIGCLHHTGNLSDAIASCRRLLRPGDSSFAWCTTLTHIVGCGASPDQRFGSSYKSYAGIKAVSAGTRRGLTIRPKTVHSRR
jgi:SAM-dependent methyltransferase